MSSQVVPPTVPAEPALPLLPVPPGDARRRRDAGTAPAALLEVVTADGPPLVATLCRNCGQAMAAPFCGRCGQRAVTGRHTVASIVGEVLGQLAVFDRGLWYTVAELTRDPGRVARRFVAGERRRFVGPIAYLSFTSAVMLLAMHTLVPDDITAVIGASRQPFLSARQSVAYVRAAADLSEQTALLTPLLALPIALAFRRRFRASGVNTAEAMVLVLYTVAQAELFYVALLPLLLLLGTGAGLRVGFAMPLYAAVAARGAVGYFGGGWRAARRGLGAFALGYAAFGVLQFAALIGYVLATVPR